MLGVAIRRSVAELFAYDIREIDARRAQSQSEFVASALRIPFSWRRTLDMRQMPSLLHEAAFRCCRAELTGASL